MKPDIVKLDDIGEQIRGVSYKPTDVSAIQQSGYTPIYRANNITENGIYEMDLVYVKNECISSKQKLKSGDILIAASSGSKNIVGKAVFINSDRNIAFGAFCKVVRAKKDTVYPKYLSYYFQSSVYRRTISHLSAGANINNIRSDDIANLQIPLPPLHIQKQIADTLDKADALRRKDQELLQKYDELAQAVFYDMFGDPVKNEKGWEVVSLNLLYSKVRDGTKCGPFGSALKKEEYVDSGIPVWTMDNINKDDFQPENCLFITNDKFNSLKTYNVINGDIIISRAGTVGKMCVVNSNYPNSIISTNLIRLSLDSAKINPVYFVKMMKYFGASIGRLKKGAEGSFTHMNTGILNDLEFALPPINIQNKFVKVITSIRTQKNYINTFNLKKLIDSLLIKYFS